TATCSWSRCRRSRAPASRPTWMPSSTWPPRPTRRKRCRPEAFGSAPGQPPRRYHDGMKLLAFETATEACSVAVLVEGRVIERFELAPRRHAELALPWADALLAEAGVVKSQLDAIAVGRGPGAFTGVRLAVARAQGIVRGLYLPVVVASIVASQAARAHGERVVERIAVRRCYVYLVCYVRDDGGLPPLDAERVIGDEKADITADACWHGVDTGFGAAEGALRKRL